MSSHHGAIPLSSDAVRRLLETGVYVGFDKLPPPNGVLAAILEPWTIGEHDTTLYGADQRIIRDSELRSAASMPRERARLLVTVEVHKAKTRARAIALGSPEPPGWWYALAMNERVVLILRRARNDLSNGGATCDEKR